MGVDRQPGAPRLFLSGKRPGDRLEALRDVKGCTAPPLAAARSLVWRIAGIHRQQPRHASRSDAEPGASLRWRQILSPRLRAVGVLRGSPLDEAMHVVAPVRHVLQLKLRCR